MAALQLALSLADPPISTARGLRPSTPCREFNGPRNPKGYGVPALGPIRRDKNGMSRGHQQVLLHRWVVEQVEGPLPPGVFVLHRCDNPPCFRYDHLFTGTKADNNADMHAKGRNRQPRGERHPEAKLTGADIPVIRRRHALGEMCKDIAADYGVTGASISAVVRRKTWRHIPETASAAS